MDQDMDIKEEVDERTNSWSQSLVKARSTS